MQEIGSVTLENEMDLILAHKRTMKLAEIAGLSLPAQTTFATAVSEVSRNTVDGNTSTRLILGVQVVQRVTYLVALLRHNTSNIDKASQGLAYAKKLVTKYYISTKGNEVSIELFFLIPQQQVDLLKIDEWRTILRNEPPVSPYEEIKRKNEQLHELSDKLRKSEEQYKMLTNSLPLMIFTMDDQGNLLFANEWLAIYTGSSIAEINESKWTSIIHPDDYTSFSLLLKSELIKGASSLQAQLRLRSQGTEEYKWHQVSINGAVSAHQEQEYRIGFIVDIHSQKVYEQTLKDNIELKQIQQELKENQQTLENSNIELNRSNLELQQFAYIASHDLQEPVRKILFYSNYLLNNTPEIDSKRAQFLSNIHSSSERMKNLIQDLLSISLINKAAANYQQVDLNVILSEVLQDLEMVISRKNAVINAVDLPVIYGDAIMMRQLFSNLISNSLKFTRELSPPEILISTENGPGEVEIIFKDNGIGFDEKYLPQIFALFKRLHSRETYEGTGLGLAICRKIVELHNGRIRASGNEGTGATFYVSLPSMAW
ncbi:sensor histidine kinase [Chitinophaga arvensicola]|uniref:histidine kinase n=1 Tax=Chitinophaga arvensicola TaxID=29529 RepID=A0A1I0R9Q8_9BACT|nr:ATP-binding protein [Chitinophaga arvensicola]SEW36944.1 hypothetical protein SAMN04488122_2448 [Chitinophaga arvensicola]